MASRPLTLAEPLKYAQFRRIWSASLLSNFGLMIQSVGAAWAMTQMTTRPATVALVQSALMAPMMLFSVPAGALADIIDRRRVALSALTIAILGASLLTISSLQHWVGPAILLALCFIIGTGQALFNPAWQASVGEQVPARALSAAVMLNGMSYNVARSFGPALGGVIVALGGAVAAFLTNAVLYLPMLLAMALWRRPVKAAGGPRERFVRAIALGFQYIFFMPAIRLIVVRTFIIGFVGSAIYALLPLVARDVLNGTAKTYGILLGCFGAGAVSGVFLLPRLQTVLSTENTVGCAAVAIGTGMLMLALSTSTWLSGAALIIAGLGWTIALTVFNIGVQLSAPSWVLGRALAGFHTASTGGIALGSWVWGLVAGELGIAGALLTSAAVMLVTAIASRIALPLGDPDQEGCDLATTTGLPPCDIAMTEQSGPVTIEVQYRIDPQIAVAFHRSMRDLRLVRRRNGAIKWSLARDIGDRWLWIEHIHYATWPEYERQRGRSTQVERHLENQIRNFQSGSDQIIVRRLLGARRQRFTLSKRS